MVSHSAFILLITQIKIVSPFHGKDNPNGESSRSPDGSKRGYRQGNVHTEVVSSRNVETFQDAEGCDLSLCRRYVSLCILKLQAVQNRWKFRSVHTRYKTSALPTLQLI